MKLQSLIILVLLNFSLIAQWNSNTAVNTVVCDTSGEQAVTKLAICPDGSTYYTWFDNRGGTYAVYIQRLDANGNRQFPTGGILVSSNPQSSSLVDWDLIADDNNNAIIIFTDTRNGSAINPFAYKVSPAGTMLWGANGITLSDSTTSYQPNPKVVQTTDGNYVILWRLGQGPNKIAMQKLNSAGVKQWGTSPILLTSGTNENYDWPSLVASDNGSVIVYWAGYTGTFISPSNYKLYTQKISAGGTRVWNATQDTVYSLGRVSGFYQPRIFSDGNNGAIYTWQDDRNTLNRQGAYVQRKNSTGTFLFPANGSAGSTNTSNQHFAPAAAYMSTTGETVMIWQESNGGQTLWGMKGQKFSANGTQMWGSEGIAFIPLNNNQPGIFTILTRDTNAICYLNESQFGSSNNLIKAFRIGKSGGFVWSGNIITPSSIISAKIRLNAVMNSSGMSILSWIDRRNDNGGVYAQNINFDGSFGTLTGINSGNNQLPERFSLEQNYPNPFNPSTSIKFALPKSAAITLKVYDISGKEAAILINNKFYSIGVFSYDFDASNLSSGVYFYSLFIDNSLFDTKKMILIK
jgi:hypothetical protein